MIKSLCEDATIEVTQHILLRCQQRKISYAEIKEVIKSGEIIEEYPDDYPYPSCLILGYNINYKKIHIVCGISSDTVHMITAYYPDTNYWEKDMKTRREK